MKINFLFTFGIVLISNCANLPCLDKNFKIITNKKHIEKCKYKYDEKREVRIDNTVNILNV